MHFPPTSVSVALLFASSALAAAVTRNDPHQADFRTFGVAGCSEDNQGVYTLTQSNVGTCKPFTAPIGSMSVTNNLCKQYRSNPRARSVYVYDDEACSAGETELPVGSCQDGAWLSYKLYIHSRKPLDKYIPQAIEWRRRSKVLHTRHLAKPFHPKRTLL
ncbi:uncharacterized protein E0L32_001608 [Thyridium curvatum]|uniref:Uncharacterized protein n=1 Tax=Thyridium curvatum TaxID=1093900 RepID=A0A507AVX7_9PEZI|nr:uncharacterized protein E0L32_001589 [Thyridium curvatum]XP_030990859.1 uncharacterized protein E0L32_001608 [Thyridium curvatum]TPX09129.1 hypothetical protein E0L32_001589 [Thyridium curvatum]TPX09148.1 hypothetical protein E0L32_001608 [Thyridium curvatum]